NSSYNLAQEGSATYPRLIPAPGERAQCRGRRKEDPAVMPTPHFCSWGGRKTLLQCPRLIPALGGSPSSEGI
ncbi:MAG: hypothetical protein ABI760_26110, partial [Ferruginibacter sp.]